MIWRLFFSGIALLCYGLSGEGLSVANAGCPLSISTCMIGLGSGYILVSCIMASRCVSVSARRTTVSALSYLLKVLIIFNVTVIALSHLLNVFFLLDLNR